MTIKITTPANELELSALKAGDIVYLSGSLLTARDAAHKRIVDHLNSGLSLPFDLKGQGIYYTGPSPAPPGKVIGSCGPTTSSRMDAYTPLLLDLGLKIMIGKGQRSPEVIKSIVRNKAVYLAATGGAAALIANHVVDAQVIAYEDLGPEAVYQITVVNMPLVVAVDATGTNLYETGPVEYKR